MDILNRRAELNEEQLSAVSGGVYDEDTIEKELLILLTNQLDLNRENIRLNSSFVDDLGADSLDVVDIVQHIEEHFKIRIPEDEMIRIRTVEDIVEIISRRVEMR